MKKLIQFSTFLLIFIASFSLSAKPDDELKKIRVLSEEYPPISFTGKQGKPTGMSVEVVNAIMSELNIQKDIEIIPWARGYYMAETGPNIMLFTVARTDYRESRFKWVGNLFDMNASIYALRDSDIRISSLNDLVGREVGVVRDGVEEQLLDEIDGIKLMKNKNAELVINQLLIKRFDLISATDLNISSILKKMDVDPDEVKLLYTYKTLGNYIVFSKDTSDEVIKLWQDEFDKLEESGFIEERRKKWFR